MKLIFWKLGLAATLLPALGACDSTPREREAAVHQELTKLDTAASAAGRTLRRTGRQVARFDSANRARRAEPLSTTRQAATDHLLLGSYAGHLAALTPATVAGAYQQLLQATRAHQAAWTARDWDYAQATYQHLNAELVRVHPDLPAREEVRIRAWQAEFTALRTRFTARRLQAATKAN